MQRYHRQRHRLMWLVLAPLALLILLYALISRPDWPTMNALPGTDVDRGQGELQTSPPVSQRP